MATQLGFKGETPGTITFSGLNSLASNSMVASSAIDFTALAPDVVDIQIEIVLDPGTTSGNKKASVLLATSLDGTNFSDTTNRGNLVWLDDITLPDTNVVRSRAISIARGLGGMPLPAAGKVVIWNDSGAAFNSSGCSGTYREVRGDTS